MNEIYIIFWICLINHVWQRIIVGAGLAPVRASQTRATARVAPTNQFMQHANTITKINANEPNNSPPIDPSPPLNSWTIISTYIYSCNLRPNNILRDHPHNLLRRIHIEIFCNCNNNNSLQDIFKKSCKNKRKKYLKNDPFFCSKGPLFCMAGSAARRRRDSDPACSNKNVSSKRGIPKREQCLALIVFGDETMIYMAI